MQESNELSLRQQMDQLSAAVAASPSAVLVTYPQTLPPPSVNAQPMGGEYQRLPASVYSPIPAAAFQSAVMVNPSEVAVGLAHNNLPPPAGAGSGAQVHHAVRSESGHGSEADGRQGLGSGQQARSSPDVTREPPDHAG